MEESPAARLPNYQASIVLFQLIDLNGASLRASLLDSLEMR